MPDPRFFLTGEPIEAAAAASLAGAVLRRGAGVIVARAAGITEANLDGAVVFVEGSKEMAALGLRAAALCLTTEELAAKYPGTGALAVMARPRLGFARLASRLHHPRPFERGAGVHPDARVDKTAEVSEGAMVAAGAEIGPRCRLSPGAVVGPGVVLGPGCVVGPNAVVMHALVGARVSFLAGAVIGEAGFGFVPCSDGPVRMPQLGRVIVGDDVEIGANSCIDRGALGDTVIGDGVKIDNLVQIGHNVTIGPGTVIAAQTGISGSVHVGAGVMMGGQVGMADHIEIGAGAQLAAQSGVMRNVPPGEKWAGTPAKSAKVWFREITLLANLAARKKQDGHEQD